MAGVTLRDVGKSFGSVVALRDLTLEVADGELLVLLGPSGCGKSTTLRLIAGLERLDAGEILIGEQRVSSLPPDRRDVAMVFQNYALFPHLGVFDNIAFGMQARRAPATETREKVRVAAEALNIGGLLERLPSQLSGGERQRVALARAMVRAPAVFLMDEPLSNLDVQLRAQARDELVRLQASLGTTTVYVTHDHGEALGMGHRLAVMNRGTIEQVGTPREIYDHPATLFVARFVGTPPMNLLARDGHLLGVRPEHVHVEGSRWSGGLTPSEATDAVIEMVGSAGDQLHLHLRVGDDEVVARAEPGYHGAPGDRVRIWFDPARLHRFDATTGARLP